MTQAGRTLSKAALCLIAAAALSACSMFHSDSNRQAGESRIEHDSGGGQPLLGGGGGGRNARGGIGVNSFLWRASLDTLSFMPLASADPFGGVIITDWYADPTTPNERFKATVYILDTRLRADGLNVALQKQTRAPDGSWLASASSDRTVRLWDPRTGTALHTLTGHGSAVTALAGAPNGSWLASAGSDGTVQLWDPRDGTALHTLVGHRRAVVALAGAPDGSSATGSCTAPLPDTLTGATNRYPRLATVSISIGLFTSSPSALRSCAIVRVSALGVTNVSFQTESRSSSLETSLSRLVTR